MAPLIVLIVVALLARLVGQLGVAYLRDWAASTRVGLAVMLCFTAAAHFNSMRPDMVAMVSPSVPNPEFMVTFTGICEILGAVGLLVPRTRRIAAVARSCSCSLSSRQISIPHRRAYPSGVLRQRRSFRVSRFKFCSSPSFGGPVFGHPDRATMQRNNRVWVRVSPSGPRDVETGVPEWR